MFKYHDSHNKSLPAWTAERPTKPGVYWVRFRNGTVLPVDMVRVQPEEIWALGEEGPVASSEILAWWPVPVEPPF